MMLKAVMLDLKTKFPKLSSPIFILLKDSSPSQATSHAVLAAHKRARVLALYPGLL